MRGDSGVTHSREVGSAPATILYRERVESSNEELRLLARQGAAAGTVLWAGQQDAGRGRRGRRWISPPGNLYCSILLRPLCAPMLAAQLGFVAALAVGDALRPLLPEGTALGLKWPNDVLIQGRKCAGILLESETGADGLVAWVVAGIGINIVSAPEAMEYPATSLKAQGCGEMAVSDVLESLCAAFFARCRIWDEQGFEAIRAAWLEHAEHRFGEVRVQLGDTAMTGRFVDLDVDGALLLETDEGSRRIAAGDVFPAG